MENIEAGKIFVGGLSWETSQEALKAYFEKWGEVSDCVIMQDPITKRPRGFGFVTFKDSTCVQSVLSQGPHVLDNKKVDPKPATMKSATQPGGGGGGGGGVVSGPVKKVFVGGIAHGTTEDDVRAYFSQFGPITDVDLKYDKATQRMRGFGFVGFETEETVDKLCQSHYHQINGKTVEVKKAEPRYATAAGQGYQQRGGGHMGAYQQASYGGFGRGSGYGGYGSYGGYGYGQQQQYGGYGGYHGGYGAQAGYGQYGQAGYGYDRYSSGQQGGSATDQSRSDYSSGYGYGQQQMANYTDTTSYGQRSSYGTGTDSYSGQTAYSYDSTGYGAAGYGDTQAGAYGRGMSRQHGYQPYSR